MGLGILYTPCRKKRDVRLAKGVGCVVLFQRSKSFAGDGVQRRDAPYILEWERA